MSFETSFTGQCRNPIQLRWKYLYQVVIKNRYFKAGVFMGVEFPPSPQNTITTPPKTIAYEAICH